VRYTHVLLDLDHTLFDTETSLRRAFEDAVAVTDAEGGDHYGVFNEINQALWRRVEAQELTPPEVHITRFRELADALQLDVDPQLMADAFAAGMGRHGDLYPRARDVLEALRGTATLAMITNGLSEIQRARIARLDLAGYFDVITISAEVGCAKPGTKIFDLTFDALGLPNRSAALMVGDSLASDIKGGTNAGIATCWYNPAAKPHDGTVEPTHTITSLDELTAVVETTN